MYILYSTKTIHKIYTCACLQAMGVKDNVHMGGTRFLFLYLHDLLYEYVSRDEKSTLLKEGKRNISKYNS